MPDSDLKGLSTKTHLLGLVDGPFAFSAISQKLSSLIILTMLKIYDSNYRVDGEKG